MKQDSSRLQVVDALRGFAIVAILLLHNLEHFDYYYEPVHFAPWLKALDKGVWDTVFFLFAGKSYPIFALLFGLTFFIQSDNQEKKGKDFRGRFAWRLLLLLGFGMLNTAFFQGDILMIYALIGFLLIPFAKMGNKAVLGIAFFLILQPFEWINLVNGIQNPDMKLANPASWAYFGKMGEYIPGNSFFDTLAGNITNGRLAVFYWTWESGRVPLTLALFMLGMLAGRKGLFKESAKTEKFWQQVLLYASLAFITLYLVKTGLPSWIKSEAILRPLVTIETSWCNLAFMLILLAGFVLLFRSRHFSKPLTLFSPLGRMSLSNYVIQSILGSFIYYGFGLGLYQYTGATYCFLIGLSLAILQGVFSAWWMKKHRQGPLETIWHNATWIGRK